MGNRIDVTAWVPAPGSTTEGTIASSYYDEPRYSGRSIIRALVVAARIVIVEHRPAKVTWRPR